MFDIVICAYNNLELTKKCVESIRKNTPKDMYSLHFVDDGSTDGTDRWMLDQQNIGDVKSFLFHKGNMGYVKSALHGVDNAARSLHPYIFLLNNDVVITGSWVDAAKGLLTDKKVAIIGAYGHKVVAGTNVDFISGSRLIVKKDILKKYGFYDSNFEMGYWEDVEFSWRIQREGYKIKKFMLPSIHNNGSSFRHNKKKSYFYNMNMKYLERKIRSAK